MILGRDFIIREGLLLDLAGGGYRLGNDAELIPFLASTHICTVPRSAAVATKSVLPERIRQLLEECPCSDYEREQLAYVLEPFAEMFTEAPGRTTVLQHRIDTGDAPPWSCNPRPLSIQKKAKLDVALDEMLNTGVVRPSQSAHASPVVLAPKKDGSVRLCVDYRRLNDVNVRDAYPFSCRRIHHFLAWWCPRVYHSRLLTRLFAN